ncbi:FCD domain-containing protein [Actinotalea sp. M2MS4P-6]|uniref:FadR/GntR family transcriptional regulator n=1 Tax=Actinotalea sp. M2MS4P-6 TaxID=2983762 RepID=UPI0021E3D921|nr:FCD domain-containing protein [Actinotalea sp. M2MS4P-6]MCV2393744.1 FCD domain-containing protein [Actinotalea sp. M2MS4P-6]
MTTFDRVLGEIGRGIVGGEPAPGETTTVEELVERTGASRSIVREATRVLASLGMLTASRRVGLRITPPQRWDALDPLVVQWRLDGPDRGAQVEELGALRLAVEPEAAAAAARGVAAGRIAAEDLEPLLGAAQDLAAAAAGDPAPFLEADRDLHAEMLRLSGNAMFARLQAVVDVALRERALVERAELPPDAHDVDLHVRAAQAIAAGDPAGAAAAMREVVERTSAGP